MAKQFLFEEVKDKDGVGSKPVLTKMTDDDEVTLRKEIAEARVEKEKIEKKLKKLEESCDHRVRIDTPSFIYDSRTCHICGAGMGFI